MKKTEFVNIIRKFIKEEVNRQVKQVVSEEMNKQMAVLLGEVIRKGSPTISTPDTPRPLNESVAAVKPAPPQKARPKLNTGNPMLDEALNSTEGGIIHEGGDNGVSMMGELEKIGQDEGIDLSEFMKPKTKEVELDTSSNMNMLKSIVSAGSAEEIPSVLDVPDEINPLAGAFKQDFRAKMKAINEKAKNVSGASLAAMVGPMGGPSVPSAPRGPRLKQGPIMESIE